jgi:hypothetical protein
MFCGVEAEAPVIVGFDLAGAQALTLNKTAIARIAGMAAFVLKAYSHTFLMYYSDDSFYHSFPQMKTKKIARRKEPFQADSTRSRG